MSAIMIHRPARVTEPVTPPEQQVLAVPPPLGDAPVGGLPLQSLLPVLGSMSSITMMVVLRSNPIMVVVGAMVLVVALTGGVGMALSSRGRQVRARRHARERYLDYLENIRSELRSSRSRIRRQALTVHPAPSELFDVVPDPARVWERRRTDADFLHARIGTGIRTWFTLSVPEDPNPVQPFDPIMAREARGVSSNYAHIGGMPVSIDLTATPVVSIVASPEQGRHIARTIVAQLAAFHSPDDLQLGLVVPPDARGAWDGADLLPHAQIDGQWDGPLPLRRVATTTEGLGALLRDEFSARFTRMAASRGGSDTPDAPLALVIDHSTSPVGSLGMPLDALTRIGVVVIAVVSDRLHEPGETSLRIVADEASGTVTIQYPGTTDQPNVENITPDSLPVAAFSRLMSMLAPLQLTTASRHEAGTVRDINALELLGVDAVSEIDPRRWQAPRTAAEFLRVAVGGDDTGNPVLLDIKESAHGGMGPHGICIGATGSGKSEFLRTLVLALATQHSPDDISMILVDYKGGAAFNPFASLPHIAGLIDNLEGEAGLVERARASIAGEVVRRQQQLKDAGALASITEYRAARAENPSLPPMPHLFLVIDEFGELLTAEPEFIELLLTIGRIGRSIGVHMLLSSQRIEGGKLKGLDSYLSYRIGLRTFSEQESQVVLNTPDAFRLPPVPGYGYLKVDTTVYTRFVSGYVSGPTPGPTIDLDDDSIGAFALPPTNTIEAQLAASRGSIAPVIQNDGPALIDDAVARLKPGISPTTPVWLPPLPERLPLFHVLNETKKRLLRVPIGLIDDPTHQHQGPWNIDLAAAGGHHAIIGAPQSGRSTFLRTMAAGIATTHTPTQATIYGLDLTGSGLARLEPFPHVGGIATRQDTEHQVRLLEELHAMLAVRERLFREHRIESLPQLRARHQRGELPQLISPDVILLVDGYGLIRSDFEHLETSMTDLLTRGGSFGIHLVVALTRWAELPMRLQPLIGNKYELRLNDPSESTISRKLSTTLKQPGRILTTDSLFAQLAMPTIDDVPDEQTGDALTALATRTAASWSGPSATPIRLLPANLDPSELPDEFDEPDRIPIGLRQDTMEPALVDFAGRDQHLLVLGDPESGKTTLIRQILNGLVSRNTPEEIVIALMEPRGHLASTLPDEYLGGHATNGATAKELSAALALELTKRQRGESPTTLRIVAVIDDYDIVAAGNTGPLDPLLPFLPQARDLGLSIILTRPVAGSARALYENTLQTIKDMGATGILLSGERAEGPLWPGVHATPAVPGRARIIRRAEPARLIQIAQAS
ncbi:type VII secretion protein EccCa [Agreia pratensis]|uniref:DNA segregation ATPase FtsK/SpoIIIE, S-DNA-T family n=1 Tax=Agreia pratensis TaxID=150121 RepID=A0A1X7JLQ7_9MICO|nr:type VII secretion protein EccCa [Agreia pratensis]SMG28981.1 DNA segregation ATPase FtsK/SpoIIIE, S-DNA-T family [Agreia pratensis]